MTVKLIYYTIQNSLFIRSYNCSTSSWSDEYEVTSYGSLTQSSSISSASNDLYAVYREAGGGSAYLKYRQYDANPLTPQGLTVSIYTLGTNTYPKLNWNLNTEPDVYNQTNAYQIERRIRLWDGPWSQWAFLANRNGNQSEFIDYSIGGLHNEAHTAEYRIRAKDVNNHFSDYSSSVSINFSKFNKTNNGLVKYDFELDQNYPNPFNPSTTINYTIKTAGQVTLKVYDMLGTEVASLVNARKEPGNYSVTFNANNLPSGIYVYRLTADKFVETKKLILLK